MPRRRAFLRVRRRRPIPAPEAQLHRAAVELWTLAGRRDVRLVHVPNELCDTPTKRVAQTLLGLWPGAPDLIFLTPCPEPIGTIELKRPGRGIIAGSDQADARDWLLASGHRWAVAHTLDDVRSILAGWHLLRGVG